MTHQQQLEAVGFIEYSENSYGSASMRHPSVTQRGSVYLRRGQKKMVSATGKETYLKVLKPIMHKSVPSTLGGHYPEWHNEDADEAITVLQKHYVDK